MCEKCRGFGSLWGPQLPAATTRRETHQIRTGTLTPGPRWKRSARRAPLAASEGDGVEDLEVYELDPDVGDRGEQQVAADEDVEHLDGAAYDSGHLACGGKATARASAREGREAFPRPSRRRLRPPHPTPPHPSRLSDLLVPPGQATGGAEGAPEPELRELRGLLLVGLDDLLERGRIGRSAFKKEQSIW